MIKVPEDDSQLRMITIDPGSDTMGLALWCVDLRDQKPIANEAFTWNASKQIAMHDHYTPTISQYGARQARLMDHYQRLVSCCHYWQPHWVVCESPFMGMQTHAFQALVETVEAIRYACWHYDPDTLFNTYAPQQVRSSLGVGGSKGKTTVREALHDVIVSDQIDVMMSLESLDEHAIDALAVGYCLARQSIWMR